MTESYRLEDYKEYIVIDSKYLRLDIFHFLKHINTFPLNDVSTAVLKISSIEENNETSELWLPLAINESWQNYNRISNGNTFKWTIIVRVTWIKPIWLQSMCYCDGI